MCSVLLSLGLDMLTVALICSDWIDRIDISEGLLHVVN